MPGDPRTLARAHIMTARPRIDSLHGIGLHGDADALNLLMIDAQVLLSNLEGADEIIARQLGKIQFLEAEVKRLSPPRVIEHPEFEAGY